MPKVCPQALKPITSSSLPPQPSQGPAFCPYNLWAWPSSPVLAALGAWLPLPGPQVPMPHAALVAALLRHPLPLMGWALGHGHTATAASEAGGPLSNTLRSSRGCDFGLDCTARGSGPPFSREVPCTWHSGPPLPGTSRTSQSDVARVGALCGHHLCQPCHSGCGCWLCALAPDSRV